MQRTVKDIVSLNLKHNISYFAFLIPTIYSYKSTQFWWLVLKLVILVLLGYFIYYTLTHNSEITWNEFYITLRSSDVFNILTISILLVFTMVNWGLEIFKWKVLAGKIQATSYKEAVKQSLASHAFALMTPNRIGEYGAKAIYYKKEMRKKVMLLNFVGNFYQLLATIFFGVISFALLSEWIIEFGPLANFSAPVLIYLTAIFAIVLMIRWLLKVPFVKRQKEQLTDGKSLLSTFKTRKVLMISLARYVVFASQFFFLITIFEELHPLMYAYVIASIGAMYLLSSIVPMLALFDFVVKGSAAIYIFSFFHFDPETILTITTLMWLLNFVLPAIIGSYFVLTFKPVET